MMAQRMHCLCLLGPNLVTVTMESAAPTHCLAPRLISRAQYLDRLSKVFLMLYPCLRTRRQTQTFTSLQDMSKDQKSSNRGRARKFEFSKILGCPGLSAPRAMIRKPPNVGAGACGIWRRREEVQRPLHEALRLAEARLVRHAPGGSMPS